MKNIRTIIFLLVNVWFGFVYAAASTNSLTTNTTTADLVATCVACHGPQGQSTMPTNPNLAGQNEKYFIAQMNAFKKGSAGKRNNPIMQAIAAPLTDDQIKALAIYFATQKLSGGSTASNYVTLGKLIYQGGIRDKKIPACAACHGPAGLGNPSAGFPVLSGQHADYLIAQLNAYQNGTRSNDLNSMMGTLSKRLSKEDVEAVANYIQGLHPFT